MKPLIFTSKGAANAKAISHLLRGEEADVKRRPRGKDGRWRYEVIIRKGGRS